MGLRSLLAGWRSSGLVDWLAGEVARLEAELAELERGPAPKRERHGPDCRHCQLVEAYRLARDSEVRYGESLACGDEDYRPVTFKEFLIAAGRERRAAEDYLQRTGAA